ncbi:hypothetical protein NFI96_020912, partial [Prochilodus magdalenae]
GGKSYVALGYIVIVYENTHQLKKRKCIHLCVPSRFEKIQCHEGEYMMEAGHQGNSALWAWERQRFYRSPFEERHQRDQQISRPLRIPQREMSPAEVLKGRGQYDSDAPTKAP